MHGDVRIFNQGTFSVAVLALDWRNWWIVLWRRKRGRRLEQPISPHKVATQLRPRPISSLHPWTFFRRVHASHVAAGPNQAHRARKRKSFEHEFTEHSTRGRKKTIKENPSKWIGSKWIKNDQNGSTWDIQTMFLSIVSTTLRRPLVVEALMLSNPTNTYKHHLPPCIPPKKLQTKLSQEMQLTITRLQHPRPRTCICATWSWLIFADSTCRYREATLHPYRMACSNTGLVFQIRK